MASGPGAPVTAIKCFPTIVGNGAQELKITNILPKIFLCVSQNK